MTAADGVEALLFDVFGTVVDWRSSIISDLSAFGSIRGLACDWASFVDDWRALYQPSMEAVRTGRRPFAILDVLHRESLEVLVNRYGLAGLSAADIGHMTRAWHRLEPWPDVLEGLARLKSKYIIGPLSNGNVGLLVRMAKHAKLPWDVVLSSETAGAYKPQPQAYLRSAELLNLKADQVMLVAAHNSDLAAAAGCGFKTAFVARPTEYGPRQSRDFAATGEWTAVASSFVGLAASLGC